MIIKFDKPFLPPLAPPGSISKELPVEFWLKTLKIPDNQFIHYLPIIVHSKNKGQFNGHMILCLDKFFIMYSKDVAKTIEIPYKKVFFFAW